jgi:hypothetical protein
LLVEDKIEELEDNELFGSRAENQTETPFSFDHNIPFKKQASI